MIYVKSALAGMVAVLLAIVLVVVGVAVYGLIFLHPPDSEAVGWDPISLMRWRIPGLGVLLLVFLAGFFWEFRRAR